MKNVNKFRVIAFTAIIVLGFLGCSGGSNGGGEILVTDGRLIITGLDSHNLKYITAVSANWYKNGEKLAGCQNAGMGSNTIGGVQAFGSQVVLDVWVVYNNGTVLSYAGNNQDVLFEVYAVNEPYISMNGPASSAKIGTVTVNFINGQAAAKLDVWP